MNTRLLLVGHTFECSDSKAWDFSFRQVAQLTVWFTCRLAAPVWKAVPKVSRKLTLVYFGWYLMSFFSKCTDLHDRILHDILPGRMVFDTPRMYEYISYICYMSVKEFTKSWNICISYPFTSTVAWTILYMSRYSANTTAATKLGPRCPDRCIALGWIRSANII